MGNSINGVCPSCRGVYSNNGRCMRRSCKSFNKPVFHSSQIHPPLPHHKRKQLRPLVDDLITVIEKETGEKILNVRS